jgi:hypothetical protein
MANGELMKPFHSSLSWDAKKLRLPIFLLEIVKFFNFALISMGGTSRIGFLLPQSYQFF